MFLFDFSVIHIGYSRRIRVAVDLIPQAVRSVHLLKSFVLMRLVSRLSELQARKRSAGAIVKYIVVGYTAYTYGQRLYNMGQFYAPCARASSCIC